jgi:hypothetical protein
MCIYLIYLSEQKIENIYIRNYTHKIIKFFFKDREEVVCI